MLDTLIRQNVDSSASHPSLEIKDLYRTGREGERKPICDSLFTKSNQRYLQSNARVSHKESMSASGDEDEVLHSEEILVLHKKKPSQHRDSFDDLPLEFITKGNQQASLNKNFGVQELLEQNIGDD